MKRYSYEAVDEFTEHVLKMEKTTVVIFIRIYELKSKTKVYI